MNLDEETFKKLLRQFWTAEQDQVRSVFDDLWTQLEAPRSAQQPPATDCDPPAAA